MKDTGEMKGLLAKFRIDTPIAHVSEDNRIHPLNEHLLGTAEFAVDFAAEFGCLNGARMPVEWL